jgi:integrase
VLVDLIGKRNKVRSVPMPSWAKQAIDEYASASGVVEGIVFRPINKGGRISGERMTEQAVYNLVTHYAISLGISNVAPHDLRRTFAKLAHKGGSVWIRSSYPLGMDRFRLQNVISESNRI